MENNLYFIFLGAFLTFVASGLVELGKNKTIRSEQSKNFRLFVRLEFRAIQKALEKLRNTLENQKFFNYMVLGNLRQAIDRLESSRKDAVYLPNKDLQEKYFDLVSDISLFLTDSSNAQQLYYAEKEKFKPQQDGTPGKSEIFDSADALEQHFTERRLEKLMQLTELNRRVDEIMKELTR